MAELVLDHDYDEQTYLKTIQEDFTQRAPNYDLGANGDMHIDLVENLLRFAPFQSPVLDIACGTGLLSSRVAAQGASVTGIDLTPAMLEVARKSCPTGEFLNGRAEQLPFADCSFGCAYICAALVYFTDIPKVLREAFRVVKRGGFLAYQAVSRDSYVTGNVLQEACEKAFGKEEAKLIFQVPNKVTDTELDNRRLLEEAGFCDIQVTSVTVHSTLKIEDVEQFWPRVVGRNGLLGRVRLLDEDAMEKLRNFFIERIEQLRDVNGLVSEKVCSWYVMGRKK